MFLCQAFGWTIEYAESITITMFNKALTFLQKTPPVHVLVAGYLGYKYSDPINDEKITQAKEKTIFKQLARDKEKLKESKNYSMFSEDFRKRIESEIGGL